MATTTAATTTGAPAEDGPIVIDTQHDDMVHDAQLDYYGVKLATSSSDRTVKIYDVSGSTYTHTATLQGHEGPVWEVSWSHPKYGVVLASCSFDGSVLIHREARRCEWALIYAARNLHESSVNSVSFSPHEYGLVVAAASSDGRVSILTHADDDSWSIQYIKDNSLGVNAVSWAPYEAYMGNRSFTAAPEREEGKGETNEAVNSTDSTDMADTPRIVTGGCDNRIRFWKLSSQTQTWEEDSCTLGTSLSHSDWVRDVAWAPAMIPGMNFVASCSEDRTVIIWMQKGGPQNEWEPTLLHTFNEPVWRVSWSVTGNILAVSSGDSTVTLWKRGAEGTWVQISTVEDVAQAGSTETNSNVNAAG